MKKRRRGGLPRLRYDHGNPCLVSRSNPVRVVDAFGRHVSGVTSLREARRLARAANIHTGAPAAIVSERTGEVLETKPAAPPVAAPPAPVQVATPTNGAARPNVRPLDEDAMRELELYIDNDQGLYRQRLEIERNLKAKIAKGRYDPAKAPKLWQYLIDQGARKYVKEFGGEVRLTFPKTERAALAARYARDFEGRFERGEVENPREVRPGKLFKAVFPTGISYADSTREEHGDYKRVGFLPFSTLEFEVIAPRSPLLAEARADAAKIQARRGEPFQVSAAGDTVILGGRPNPHGLLPEHEIAEWTARVGRAKRPRSNPRVQTWRPDTIPIHTTAGRVQVAASVYRPGDGLFAIHRGYGARGWRVTHVRTGYSVVWPGLRSEKWARFAVRRLLELIEEHQNIALWQSGDQAEISKRGKVVAELLFAELDAAGARIGSYNPPRAGSQLALFENPVHYPSEAARTACVALSRSGAQTPADVQRVVGAAMGETHARGNPPPPSGRLGVKLEDLVVGDQLWTKVSGALVPVEVVAIETRPTLHARRRMLRLRRVDTGRDLPKLRGSAGLRWRQEKFY